jgi:membrane-associated protein
MPVLRGRLRGFGATVRGAAPPVLAVASRSRTHPIHDLPGLQAPGLVERHMAPVRSAALLSKLAFVFFAAAAKAHAAGGLQGWLLGLHGPVVYAAVGGLLFLEVGFIVGFFVPGEVATILGGVIASQHHANLVVMILVVAICASLGNLSGYLVGRTIGPWLLERRFLKGNAGLTRTRELIAHHGGPAVFIGRWVVFVRAVLPGMAGISHMRLAKFVVFSIAGGVVWGTMWVLIGYAAGSSYTSVEKAVGNWSLVILGVVVVALGIYLFYRKRKEKRLNRALLEGGAG